MSQIKYLTDDIDELDAAEHDLEANGIPRSHIHVLSHDTLALREHDLPSVSEWSQREIMRYGTSGAVLGGLFFIAILGTAFALGLNDAVGWVVVTFVATAAFGFCLWEGGLMGIIQYNRDFSEYRNAIDNGEHLLVVDVDGPAQESTARYTVESHPHLRAVH